MFTIPAIKFLSQLSAKYTLRIFCYKENEEIYKLILNDSEYTIISREDIYYDRFFNLKARKELHLFNPDIILDLTGTVLSASLIMGSKGEKYGLTQYPYDALFTRWVTKRTVPHLMDVCFDALSTFVEVPKDVIIKAFPVADTLGTQILIHPGAGWAAKEWGKENYVGLIKELENLGYNCRLITGEASNSLFNDGLHKDMIIKTKDLQELIRNIKKCSAFIGNDSGPLYIANLLGKPTFTIYGPTNPQFSKPYGECHSFIQKRIQCSPLPNEQYCYTDAGRSGCPSFECMRQLKVEDTLKSVLDFLRKNNIHANA